MIVATCAALAILPLLVLRRATLLHCYATQLTIALFAWIVWRRLLPAPDARFAFIALAVIEFAVFAWFLARGTHVRWSANHAAVIAAIVYALVIAATAWKVDGDEPYYLMLTESLLSDGDVDLSNQFGHTASGRNELGAQFGDPVGPNGERYSRHQRFLSMLMLPGFALGGLHGALAVIAFFGALLVRSTIRWMEDEGIPDASARAVFPLFAFAPPVLFYATRMWPEVPAAFFFVEALRGVRAHREKRWVPALTAMVALKLRFGLVAIALVLMRMRTWRARFVAAAILAVPLAVLWWRSVHQWWELVPMHPLLYVRGVFGLLADGRSGILFQAPFYLLGLAALLRWRETPRGFRAGVIASLLYLFYLLPRQESFSNYGPPLRYLVFMLPVLALGAGWMWERIPRGAIAIISAWSAGLVIHGIAFPYRLFFEAGGENAMSEWLSRLYASDFSRLFPSFVRHNDAAWIGSAVVIALLLLLNVRAKDAALPIAMLALLIAIGFRYGRQPAARVEFEDAHVTRDGGHLEPPSGTANRTAYRAGWVLEGGQSLTFLARAGTHHLHAITGLGAIIEVGGNAYRIEPSRAHRVVRVTIPESGPVTLRCVSGAVNLDRMELR